MTSSVTIIVTTTGNNTTNITQCSDTGVVPCANITTTARGGGVKTQCGDSGVVESDTDTMSCCDDDSSPDQYQPIGLHHCGGVADKNKTLVTTQDGCVAKIRPLQSTNSNSNNFPSDDDPELDRIFASVEVCSEPCTVCGHFYGTCGQKIQHCFSFGGLCPSKILCWWYNFMSLLILIDDYQ